VRIQRRSVRELQRRRGRSEHRSEHAEGHGDDLRPRDAGGTGFLSRSRSSKWLKKSSASEIADCRGQRRRPRRRWEPRSVPTG
jgi:hypothetical protein